jgi:type II secretory pathway pseudopilin PulG
MMAKNRAAYSLVELVIIVIFLGIIAAIAVPRVNFSAGTKQKADTVAWKIVTDLCRTRGLAISDAANNPTGYALNMSGSAPYSGYEIENLDTAETIDSHTIDSAITCAGGASFQFGPLGNLEAGSDTQLTVSASGKTFTIAVTPATGMVKCTED